MKSNHQTESGVDMFDLNSGGDERASGNMWPNADTAINDGVIGRVVVVRRVGTGDKAYDVATMSPAIVGEGGKFTAFKALSFSVKATLKGRVSERDIKSTLSIVYKGEEQGANHSTPYKLFDVRVQDESRLAAMLDKLSAPEEIKSLLPTPF